jgi:ElaB/YqjD/DUF883 family membrane-anchored ribosome-binding protein
MDTNRNAFSGLEMPSGFEVEAATLHVPVGDPGTHSHVHEAVPVSSGISGRLDELKDKSREQLEHLRRSMTERSTTLKNNVTQSVALTRSKVNSSIAHAKSSLRDETSHRVSDVQTSMRTNPMKWAGIAAGAGFGLGLIGRIAHWRNKHQHLTPNLIVIERSC